MKPMIDCLDEMLKDLLFAYRQTTRPPMQFDRLQKFIADPQERHETYIGLVDMLIEDGYAYLIQDPKIYTNVSKIDIYRASTLITVKGMYFIENGGYTRKSQDDKLNRRLKSWMEWTIAIGTVLAGGYCVYEIIKDCIN